MNTTTPGAQAPTTADKAADVEQMQDISTSLHDLTQGLFGLQALLHALGRQDLEATELGMVDGAAAIVARLGILADRPSVAVGGTRMQSDSDWLGLSEPEGAAA